MENDLTVCEDYYWDPSSGEDEDDDEDEEYEEEDSREKYEERKRSTEETLRKVGKVMKLDRRKQELSLDCSR